MIWFNPPYSGNVKTNIGKEFLKLLRIHFHERHSFRKIFNRHTVKLSYSCTKNIGSIISGHNRKMTRSVVPEPEEAKRECNCRNKEACPMDNRCLTENIIYEAEVKNLENNEVKSYIGLCSTSFKDRLAVHKQHINNVAHRKKCELANHVWQLKDEGKGYNIGWKILKEVRGRLVGGACRLCTTEMLHIIEYPDKEKLLNSKCVEKCRHGAKFSLKTLKCKTRGRGAVD